MRRWAARASDARVYITGTERLQQPAGSSILSSPYTHHKGSQRGDGTEWTIVINNISEPRKYTELVRIRSNVSMRMVNLKKSNTVTPNFEQVKFEKENVRLL